MVMLHDQSTGDENTISTVTYKDIFILVGLTSQKPTDRNISTFCNLMSNESCALLTRNQFSQTSCSFVTCTEKHSFICSGKLPNQKCNLI